MTFADHGSALRADEVGPAGRVAAFAGFPRRFRCPFACAGARSRVPGRVFLALRSMGAYAVLQDLGEDRRLAVADVPGRGQQRDGSGGCQGAQPAESSIRYVPGQLGGIAAAELAELRRIVPVPRPQPGGRCDVPGPFTQPGRVLAQAPRPHPVDQHARPVLRRRVVVDAADPDVRLHARPPSCRFSHQDTAGPQCRPVMSAMAWAVTRLLDAGDDPPQCLMVGARWPGHTGLTARPCRLSFAFGLPRELPGTGTVRRELIEASGPAVASRPQRLANGRCPPRSRAGSSWAAGRIMLACARFERTDLAPPAVPDGRRHAAGLLRPGRSSNPSRQSSPGGTQCSPPLRSTTSAPWASPCSAATSPTVSASCAPRSTPRSATATPPPTTSASSTESAATTFPWRPG